MKNEFVEPNEAIVLKGYDWEALYINEKLEEEGECLEERYERVLCFCELSKRYNFDIHKVQFIDLTDEDAENVMENGGCPKDIRDFNEDYTNY